MFNSETPSLIFYIFDMCSSETKEKILARALPLSFALCWPDCFAGFLFPPESSAVSHKTMIFSPLGGISGLKERLSCLT